MRLLRGIVLVAGAAGVLLCALVGTPVWAATPGPGYLIESAAVPHQLHGGAVNSVHGEGVGSCNSYQLTITNSGSLPTEWHSDRDHGYAAGGHQRPGSGPGEPHNAI